MRTTAVFIATLLIATACSKAPETPPAPAAPAPQPAAQAPTRAAPPVANVHINPKVRFTSDPAVIRRCETTNGRAAVKLEWNALGAGSKNVRVLVSGRTFTHTSARGSATTGKWVRERTEFTLADGDTGEVLAKLKVPFVNC